MAAEPFMRPAIDEKGPEAITEIGYALWDGIDKEAATAPKGNG
jgi:hypothetical protein